MEKDIKLGQSADLDLTFSGGKAQLLLKAEALGGAASAQLGVTLQATALVDLLFAAIEKASPPGAVPIEETVKNLVKTAVASL